MTSLITEYAGLTLKNPIVVAAGPWSRNGTSIQRAIDAGAAAVVTETITMEEAAHQPSPHLFFGTRPEQMFNTTQFSDMPLEQWEQDLECLQKGDCKIIASIYGSSPSEVSYLAGKVERMGADAIEVTISAPVGIRNRTSNSNPQEIHDYIRAAVEATEIPVIVKLSYEAANSPTYIEALEQAGAHGVTAINSLKGLKGIDLENHRAYMSTYGGYSGVPIRPIALATVATLKQLTQIPIFGCGGIQSAEDALEFMMLGARSVQLASVILREGYGAITKIIEDLQRWMEAHQYRTTEQLIGQALDSLWQFEEVLPQPLVVQLDEGCDGCGRCTASCIYDALQCSEQTLTILSKNCTGCGMCVAVCPQKALRLGW